MSHDSVVPVVYIQRRRVNIIENSGTTSHPASVDRFINIIRGAVLQDGWCTIRARLHNCLCKGHGQLTAAPDEALSLTNVHCGPRRGRQYKHFNIIICETLVYRAWHVRTCADNVRYIILWCGKSHLATFVQIKRKTIVIKTFVYTVVPYIYI